MDKWNYNAPTYDVFREINTDDYSEAYFDTDHESVTTKISTKEEIMTTNMITTSVVSTEVVVKQEQLCKEESTKPQFIELFQPQLQVAHPVIKTEKDATPEQNRERMHRRRSKSIGSIMESMGNNTNGFGGLSAAINKLHLSQQNGKIVEEMKSKSTNSSQSNLFLRPKYISMAEAIYHLQKDTPKRFHSSSRKEFFEPRAVDAALNRKKVQQLRSTIPQSPALMAKGRTRPVTALSQKELEDLEVKEIKKYHIKALPISKAVVQGIMNLAPVQRRPNTQPEPFKLTQIRKKPPVEEPKHVFTARPVPKHILEKPAELVRKVIPSTIPKTPNFKYIKSRSLDNVCKGSSAADSHNSESRPKCQLNMMDKLDVKMQDQIKAGHSGVPLSQRVLMHPCKPQPFSFEQRDKERQMKKMEKIQKVYEEEKKLREFHANPIPTVVLNKNKVYPAMQKHLESRSHTKTENKENVSNNPTHVFKARHPYVLFTEPFVPEHKDRPALEPCQVNLVTEKRAREREEYNQMLKTKEEQLENVKKMVDEENKIREEQETAALRAQLVHKAVPVKHFAPFVVHRSNAPLTKPETPKFASHKSH